MDTYTAANKRTHTHTCIRVKEDMKKEEETKEEQNIERQQEKVNREKYTNITSKTVYNVHGKSV